MNIYTLVDPHLLFTMVALHTDHLMH